jgi:ribulose-phosphate 3-epimerase
MSIPVVPAVIPESEAHFIEMTKLLRFSHEFHLDLTDGKFVPAVSWPFVDGGEAIAIKPHTDKYTLEVDLMVENPIPVAREWIRAGADMLVFHIETVDVASFNDFVTHAPKGVTVGVSFAGDTNPEAVFPYLEYAEYVQIMGIHMIGSQGQPFDETVFNRIAAVQNQKPDILISIDGAVSAATLPKLVSAGAHRFIVGSAIVGQSDPENSYRELVQVVQESLA